MDLCSASAIQPISLSSSSQCSLVILQALSLSLPKSPSFTVTLQALVAKVTKLLTQPNANLTCNATQCIAAQSLPPIFLTLTTTVRNSIAYIYHIYHATLGHRYFNLAVPWGICLRYAHASHKPASAFRLPNL